jgi:hypothetical protein
MMFASKENHNRKNMRSLILLFVMLTAASAHEASALSKKEFKNWESEYFGPHYQKST